MRRVVARSTAAFRAGAVALSRHPLARPSTAKRTFVALPALTLLSFSSSSSLHTAAAMGSEGSTHHYVLKTSMEAPDMAAASAGIRSVVFGTGCFWGSEKGFWRMGRVGVVSTSVGYAGGHAENPTYKQVCTGARATNCF